MKARFDGTGDVIVVTGGASGISRALAVAAAETGARVIVCDLDIAALKDMEAEEPRISTRRLDVSDRSAVFDTIRAIETKFGSIDGLVCGAAVQPRTPAHGMDPDEWSQ